MMVPKEIIGKKQLRDLDICCLYISGMTPEEIVAHRNLKITTRRVEQIIYTNSTFVNPRVAWPKSKRIHLRQRLIEGKLRGEKISRKDVLEHLNGLQEEVEGNKTLIDQSQHRHITIILDGKSDIQTKQAPDRVLQE
jgi:hypothetical protein